MRHLLLFPMGLYVLYIWCVAVTMFRTRVGAIRSGQVKPKYFKLYEGQELPERAVVIEHHYQNQFEVPVLFLITCATFIALDSVTTLTLVLAWIFVLSRGVHAWIHLGSNTIIRRVVAFATGWIAVVALWVQLLVIAFQHV